MIKKLFKCKSWIAAEPEYNFEGVKVKLSVDAAGWWGGTIIADYVYDTLCNPAENEEYTICE